ncbi:cytochrome P450 [Streptomyces sp. URMC 127]|uniref:cytochrome P450 n=1 Tax=Streptomyces sp. URMC 127 TaxID=3423402 RepID=UPI003F1B1E4D
MSPSGWTGHERPESEAVLNTRVHPFPACPFSGEPPPLPEGPVFRARLPRGDLVWVVTGYEEVRAALNHPLLGRHVTTDDPHMGAEASMAGVLRDRTLLLDGPAHTQLRRLAAKPLAAGRVAGLLPRIRQLADRLLDGIEETGPPADLVARLAFPLPLGVLCDLLGVPARDGPAFRQWADRMTTIEAATEEETLAALHTMFTYLTGHLEGKRTRPGEDLLSAWLAAQEADDTLSDAEIIQLAFSVLFAGYESTAAAIGACIYGLLRHPEQLDILRASPGLLPNAVRALMRSQLATPYYRVLLARTDFRLGGVTVERGDGVMPLTWAAQRDPGRFPDRGSLDIRHGGEGAPDFVFGYGPHACLGAALATAMVEIALGTLIGRLPGLRPAVPPQTLAWHTDRFPGGGLRRLPVCW